MKNLFNFSNYLGIASATLCVVHCILTPFLIVLVIKYEWWANLSYLFLLVSFTAAWEATKSKPPRHIFLLVWIGFAILSFCIILEDTFEFAELLSYFASLVLVLGHILNIKHCRNC
ncbi:MerC mercury resistance protein [Spirosomataceae bacterium TFI 002]|nr:MerC mercury resistance protein [Spirosomataceae bacterium TFI 002]